MTSNPDSLAGEYENLASDRDEFLQRAYESAAFTLPTLLTNQFSTRRSRQGFARRQEVVTPFQSIGARAVNNLSAKLVLTLFPPNSPFFRYVPEDPSLLEDPEVDQSLASIERRMVQELEVMGFRVDATEAIKHLLVTGSVLHVVPLKGRSRLFPLDAHVVQRDGEGTPIKIITEELVAPELLPGDLPVAPTDEDMVEDSLKVYTGVERIGPDLWFMRQEMASGAPLVEPKQVTTQEHGFIPLRLTSIPGEDYGRGLVEEYIGSLRSAESLSRAIVEGSLASARLLFLVNPNGLTMPQELNEVPNGGFARGRADDITALQAQKQADLTVAAQVLQRIEDQLAAAFLLNSTVQRQAERVTAEEIRFVAQELQEALGGIYAILTEEYQLPVVRALFERAKRSKKIPNLPKGVTEPAIVTGVSALGRGQDLAKLQLAAQTIISLLGPQFASQVLKPAFAEAVFVAAGLNPTNWLKSEEELAQEQANANIQELVQQLGPEAIRTLSKQIQQ